MLIKLKNALKKKKRPIDILGNIKKPHLEEAYAKFPGEKLRSISKKRKTNEVKLNNSLIEKFQRKYGKEYTHIHTHSEGDFIPSAQDLINFLGSDDRKTAIIVPLDKKTNEPKGYFAIKKNRGYDSSKIKKEDFINSIQTYNQNSLLDLTEDIAANLKDMAKKYNFSYRFFPAEGVALSKKAQGFKSSRQSLETKLSTISFLFLSSSILFGLPNITGNVILKLATKTSNTISIGLFLVGTCFAGLALFFINKARNKST